MEGPLITSDVTSESPGSVTYHNSGLFHGLSASQDTDSAEAVNNMGQGLDADHDGKVGFEEYMKLVGYLAVSLSEQRNLAKEEPAQNATAEQVAQSGEVKVKEEEKPDANAEAKAEAKPEVCEEAKADAANEVKVEANAEPKVDVKLNANATPKVEVKAEGATEPEGAAEEEKPAAAEMVAKVVEVATAEEVVVTEEVIVVNTEENMEEATEKLAAAVEEVEKKIEEAS